MNLRVWYVKNPPRGPEHFPVDSVEQAIAKINEMVNRDLEDPRVTDNAFGLEVSEDDEWTEYYDEIGNDILEIIEEAEEAKEEKTEEEEKAARDCGIVQLIQSQCVHRRRDFLPEKGQSIQRCLDCGRILYGI